MAHVAESVDVANSDNEKNELQQKELFLKDGYLVLSNAIEPNLLVEWQNWADGFFEKCLQTLYENGHTAFPQHSRALGPNHDENNCNPHNMATNNNGDPKKTSQSNNDGNAEEETEKRDTKQSQKHLGNGEIVGDVEYAMGLGVKNGFHEIVMRSPGRYEISLLNIITGMNNNSHGKQKQPCKNAYNTRNNHEDENDENKNNNNIGQQQQQQQKLVVTLPPSLILNETNATTTTNTTTNGATSFENSTKTTTATTPGMRIMKQLVDHLSLPSIIPKLLDATTFDEEVTLCHVSLLVSTPGSTLQNWHADGGHVNIQEHKSCHCFNVFIPLVDVLTTELGPTEIRPGTHYHTRDLTKLMLLAKVKKTLRPPTIPLLSRGDALIFDYRVLHRGLPNLSSQNQNRSILVLTFAKSWFKDVCNFPTIQKSLFLENNSSTKKKNKAEQ